MARPNKRAFGSAGGGKKIFMMTQTVGKKGCRGKAAVLLCGVSSEARSTTYCSNRLPASTALLGEPLTGRERHKRTRRSWTCAFASHHPAASCAASLAVFEN